MKILHINKVKIGMKLAQNIFRNDSLLAFPKGVTITGFELTALKNYGLEYILVNESFYKDNSYDDINYTLDVIESVYTHNTLWDQEFGKELYEQIEKRIIKNKRLRKYLNELRALDSYSFAHCINISVVTGLMLKRGNQIDKDFIHLMLLTLVHDVGRIKMNKIFNKEGKLTSDEFRQLQKHPEVSYKLLRKAGFSEYELKFVQETHEKYDGTGYPYKLKGEEISNLAQIILIADVYNALSSHRPYRDAFLPHEVVEIIKEEDGKGFGNQYVEHFLKCFEPYKKGDQVELTDGSIGIVKIIHSRTKMLPIVDILNENGVNVKTIDLANHKEIAIKKIIQPY